MALSSKSLVLVLALALLVVQAAFAQTDGVTEGGAATTESTTTTSGDGDTVVAADDTYSSMPSPTSDNEGTNRRSLLPSDSVDSKMVKMEKLRSQMFNTGGSPVQQVAALKEGSRERRQERLTKLFEGTQKAQLARKKAKEAMDRAFVQANPEAK